VDIRFRGRGRVALGRAVGRRALSMDGEDRNLPGGDDREGEEDNHRCRPSAPPETAACAGEERAHSPG